MFTTTVYAANNADSIIVSVADKIINPLIYLLFVVAFVLFLWGLVQFIRKSNNPDSRKIGQQHMMWSVVGFVIMFSAYTIMNIIVKTFGFKTPDSSSVDLNTLGQDPKK
ncbi:MAG: pilin [Minisyncoccia bacterium]